MRPAPTLAAYDFGGSTMTMLMPAAETDGAFALVHIIKSAGSSTPMHLHDSETEISYVLEGDLALETPAGISRLGVDEWHVLPPRHAHRLFNDSPTEMREFLICAPAIFDRFVATAGKPVAPFSRPEAMTDEARRRISTHAPDFGIRLFRETPSQSPPVSVEGPPEILDALGGRFEVLTTLGDQEGALAFLRFTMQPGSTMPSTVTADRQGLYLIKGQIDIDRDGEGWQPLTPQAAANVAPGGRYALKNAGEFAATVLVVSTVRLVRCLRSIDAATRSGGSGSSEAAIDRRVG